jgi:cytochrome c oxidase subunit I
VAMVFGFLYYLGKPGRDASDSVLDRAAFWGFTAGSLGFVLSFLYAGKESVARRYAVHLPEWLPYDRLGSLFAVLVVASALLFVVRFLSRLGLAGRDYPRATLAHGATP